MLCGDVGRWWAVTSCAVLRWAVLLGLPMQTRHDGLKCSELNMNCTRLLDNTRLLTDTPCIILVVSFLSTGRAGGDHPGGHGQGHPGGDGRGEGEAWTIAHLWNGPSHDSNVQRPELRCGLWEATVKPHVKRRDKSRYPALLSGCHQRAGPHGKP